MRQSGKKSCRPVECLKLLGFGLQTKLQIRDMVVDGGVDMYIVYAKMDHKDVEDYEGIIKLNEQEEFVSMDDAMLYINFLKVFSDRRFHVRIDQMIGDDMNTVLDKTVR